HRPGGRRRPGRGGRAAAGPGRTAGRRRLAAHPRQPGAGHRRRPRPGRTAGPLPRRGPLGHQPHRTGAAGRARVPRPAAAAPGPPPAPRPPRAAPPGLPPHPPGMQAAPAGPAPGPTHVPLQELMASPAVTLFVDRARAVRPSFALTEGNAAAVAEICRRLDGLPLAIELAAARTRLLDPGALLDRLAPSLDAPGTGTVAMPGRQRTLRATVEWTVGLLDDKERSLLEIMAIFVGGWTVEAAAEIAGLGEGRALDLSEALARHSLVQLDPTERGPRLRMLG